MSYTIPRSRATRVDRRAARRKTATLRRPTPDEERAYFGFGALRPTPAELAESAARVAAGRVRDAQCAARWVAGQRAAGWPYDRAVYALHHGISPWERSDAAPSDLFDYMTSWYEVTRWCGWRGLAPEDIQREIAES